MNSARQEVSAQRPSVHVVATGGSISGLGPHRLDYILYPELGQRSSIEQMLARIPEVKEVAEVQAENLIRVGSGMITGIESLARPFLMPDRSPAQREAQ